MATYAISMDNSEFQEVMDGGRMHSVQLYGNRYNVGDVVRCREHGKTEGEYTGREAFGLITAVTRSERIPSVLVAGSAVLSIRWSALTGRPSTGPRMLLSECECGHVLQTHSLSGKCSFCGCSEFTSRRVAANTGRKLQPAG